MSVAGCTAPSSEAGGTERVDEAALTLEDSGHVGSKCNTDGDCAPKHMCTTGDLCACGPGLVACGKECVALASDESHCGGCKTKCDKGVSCLAGVCGGAMPKHDAPFDIDGTNHGYCYGPNEAYPEQSLTGGTADEYVIYQNGNGLVPKFNWASAPTSWSVTPQDLTSNDTDYGDPWATSGAASGEEYVSRILFDASTSQRCIGMAATDVNNMANGVWLGNPNPPYVCATVENAFVDGPSIHYDPGSSVLWAIAKEGGGGANGTLHVFPSCGSGSIPGQTGGCAESHVGMPVDTGPAYSHPTVNVNPCTHHAIVAYRDHNTNYIHLKFYDTSGTLWEDYVVDYGASWGSVTDCPSGNNYYIIPKCGGPGSSNSNSSDCGGTGCAPLASKVHVATQYNSNTTHCYADVGYDSLFTGPNGNRYMSAFLAIVDITNEASISWPPAPWLAASYGNNYNTFNSITTASYVSNNVGWFYYAQGVGSGTNDACNTRFKGQTNTNSGSGSWTAQLLDPASDAYNGFPWLTGIRGNDYIGIIQRGLPGGYLFPTWNRPVGSNPCISCQGYDLDLSVWASEITSP